ncbi:MAG TPA: hypothetical protein VHH52_02235 [Pseudonocardiaceae bacterium]|jgi:hypothetical protein|nr:hypothetical protein [Pseudonocardiaceae bacterium]
MFLYIYVDYSALYKPALIDNLRAGVVFEFDISPTLLTMMLASVASPALMVMLSMTLPVRVNRATNLGPQRVECVGGHLIGLGSPRARDIRRKYERSAVPTARSNQAPGLMCPPPASVKVEAPTRSRQGAI